MKEIVEKGVCIFHGPSALPVPVFPNANPERRSRPRERLSGSIVVLALGYRKRRVLLAQLLEGALVRRLGLGARVVVGAVANLRKERVLSLGYQAAGSAAHPTAPSLLLFSRGPSAGGAAIATALLAARGLVGGFYRRRRSSAGAGRRVIIGRRRLTPGLFFLTAVSVG